ncbi:MAG: hypothetical protein ACXVEJ_03545 [Nocardioides sp.]
MRSLDALPVDLDPGVVGQAMQRLLDLAEHHDAKSLQILGRRILDVVDPERADQEEERQLRRDEAKAAATMRLTMSDDGHGRVHGRFTLPAAQGAMLKKILLGFAAPSTLRRSTGLSVSGSRIRCGWGVRSRRWSSGTRPTRSPPPAASTPPWS